MVRYKFSRTRNKEFETVLRKRVNEYFKDENMSTKANRLMVLKSISAYFIYLVPFTLALTLGIESFPILLALFIIAGFGKGFVGTSVMHDSLHGSYTSNKTLANLLHVSAISVGVYAKNWKIMHNMLHHMYTNIQHVDEDISPPGVLRFSPFEDHKSFHRFQHIYVLFFYGISTIFWVISKDYMRIMKYVKDGLVKKEDLPKHFLQMTWIKGVYFSIFLGLPLLILPVTTGEVILLFVTMHVVAGIFLGLIFGLAHVMPTSDYVEQEDLHIDENWFVHQLQTTTNFGMNDKVLSWIAGGLNYQVEHHLFPHVCHIHYPAISKIVQRTTEEYGIPYFAEKSVWTAIGSHFRMLRMLGNDEFKLEQKTPEVEAIAA